MTRIISISMLVFFLTACSGSEEQDEKKGGIEQRTDQLATEAVEYIKVPVEQAKNAAAEIEAHSKTMQEAKDN